jgi:hypothetical protein
LSDCLRVQRLTRVAKLAEAANVELMVHPEHSAELNFLIGREFTRVLGHLPLSSYAHL